MNEKPGKRLVTWNYYFGMLSKKVIACALIGFFGFIAFVAFRLAGTLLWGAFEPEWRSTLGLWVVLAGLLCAVGSVTLWGGFRMLTNVKNAEKIAPITRHNTGDLPEVETLVRSSDLRPSHQQAELLRAAKPGQETPPEELLRAAQTNRDNG
jgi:hypothetical protein